MVVSARALSKASPTEPIEATNPDKARVSPNRTDVYCEPASLLSRIRLNSDRGSTYTANAFTALCRRLGIRQSMVRVGSCFDNAAAEAFFSSLEWEVLSRNSFRDTIHAQAVVIHWCYTFYNHQRRHSAADGLSPVNYEIRESNTTPEAA